MVSQKVSPRLINALSSRRRGAIRVIVWTISQTPSDQLLSGEKARSMLEYLGFKSSFFETYSLRVRHLFSLVGAFSATVPCDAALRLAKEVESHEGVAFLDESSVYRINLNVTVPLIRVDLAWKDYGYTGRGVRIAIVDTGVDAGHPDLKGRVVDHVNYASCPPSEEDPSPDDLNGHGTHVAGIAAGAGEKYRGVAPEAEILNAKAINEWGLGCEDDIAAAMEWSLRKKANVVNLSIGGEDKARCRDLVVSVAEALAKRGVVVVAAAGNSGPDFGTINSPGCSPLLITVGAVAKDGSLAFYSSRGPTKEGLEKPDLLAPGGDPVNPVIAPLSSRLSPERLEDLKSHIVEDKYLGMTGTSMAAPHVAGVAALLLEEARELDVLASVDNPHNLVKHVLMSTARDLGYSKNEQGAGLVDAYAAVEYLKRLANARRDVVKERVEPQPSVPSRVEQPSLLKAAVEQLSRDLAVDLARSLGYVISSAIVQGARRKELERLEEEARSLISQLKTLETLRNAGLITESESRAREAVIYSRLKEIYLRLENIKGGEGFTLA